MHGRPANINNGVKALFGAFGGSACLATRPLQSREQCLREQRVLHTDDTTILCCGCAREHRHSHGASCLGPLMDPKALPLIQARLGLGSQVPAQVC